MLAVFDPRARYLTGPPFNPRARYLTGMRGRLRGFRGMGADPTMDPVDFPVDVSTPAFDFTNPAAAFGPLQTIDTPQNVYAPNFVGPLQPGSVQLQTPAVIAQDTSAIAAAAGIAQPGAYDFPMVAAVKLGATAVNAAGQFVNAAGQVVNPTAAQIAAAQAAVQGSVVSGIPNTYLWIGLGALALLGVMSGSRR